MSRRLMFLIGHLSGLLVGAALVYACIANTQLASRPLINKIPGNPVVVPVRFQTSPEVHKLLGTPRYFNGQPFYIIPTETENTPNQSSTR